MRLRPAEDRDREFFLELRNDPAALRASRRPAITLEEHDHWWRNTSDLLYVAEYGEQRVGTLRVSADGLVSIVVAPRARGLGYGPAMLGGLLPCAKDAGFGRLFAEVAPENVRSQKAFLKAGWHPVLFERET